MARRDIQAQALHGARQPHRCGAVASAHIWLRWMVIWALCSLGGGWLSAHAQSPAHRTATPPTQNSPLPSAGTDSPAWKELLAVRLPEGDSKPFTWLRATEALDRPTEGGDLRRGLLDQWLRSLEGPTWPATTVEQLMEQGRLLTDRDLEQRARMVWERGVNSAWRPQWSPEDLGVPLPAEIEALSRDLAPEGPGLWRYQGPQGPLRGLFWWLGMRHTQSQALPLTEFTLAMPAPSGSLTFECLLPRYATQQAVPPGSTLYFLCRTPNPPNALLPKGTTWSQVLDQGLKRGTTLTQTQPGVDPGLTRVARSLSSLHNPQVEAFIVRTRSCEMRGACPRHVQEPPRPAPTSPHAPSPAPWKKRFMVAGGLAGTLLAYGLIAHHISPLLAGVLLWIGLAIPCGLFLQSLWSTNWADSWGGLVVIPASLMALAAPFVGTALAQGVYRLCVSAEARRKALAGAGVVLAVIVLNLLERWLS